MYVGGALVGLLVLTSALPLSIMAVFQGAASRSHRRYDVDAHASPPCWRLLNLIDVLILYHTRRHSSSSCYSFYPSSLTPCCELSTVLTECITTYIQILESVEWRVAHDGSFDLAHGYSTPMVYC